MHSVVVGSPQSLMCAQDAFDTIEGQAKWEFIMRLVGGQIESESESESERDDVNSYSCAPINAPTGILQSAKSVGVVGGFLALYIFTCHTYCTYYPYHLLIKCRGRQLFQGQMDVAYYSILHYTWHTKDKNRHSPYLVFMFYTLVENMVFASLEMTSKVKCGDFGSWRLR